MKNMLVVLTVFAILACSNTPQDVKLVAHAQIEDSDIGIETLIEVKVVDERTRKSLGYKVFKSAKITTDQNIPSLLHSALVDAYAKKGFIFNASDNLKPTMIRVDLREFSYYTARGLWVGEEQAKAAVKVSLLGSAFEKMFIVENEESLIGVSKTEQLLNQTLRLLIEQIVNDPELTSAIISQKEKTETTSDPLQEAHEAKTAATGTEK